MLDIKEKLAETVGKFTWDFGQNFFIETEFGNFVWSDPSYDGDNTIIRFNGSVYGRNKGEYMIGDFCGKDFVFVL